MTSLARDDILSYCGDHEAFYAITNSLDATRGDDDSECPGLIVRTDGYCTQDQLTDFVRQADIDILTNDFYLDEGLFRMILINAFLGKQMAGWIITEITIDEYYMSFFLRNPALEELCYASSSSLETLKEFKKLGAEHEYSDDADKLFAGPLLPAPQVYARWGLPANPDERYVCEDSFSFTVQAPKPSGEYPKHKRTTIRFVGGSPVEIEEISKRRYRNIRFLSQSPDQKKRREQPVHITDTYYA